MQPERSCDVAFVTMPFAALEHPALGLSLLRAQLARAGIDSTIAYLNLAYGARCGAEFYARVCAEGTTALIGDWIFAAELHDPGAEDEAVYAARYLRPRGEEFAAQVAAARRNAGDFLAAAAAAILERKPKVAGFTSTFQQHAASLALARRLKRADPALHVIFGGANCEAAMGAQLVASFPWVDAVVSGEGERVVEPLVARLLRGETVDDLAGVYTPSNAERIFASGFPTAPPVEELDALPYPAFDDFFAARNAYDAAASEPLRPRLLFESARGCWWGEKHHCTFCGLNGTTMHFRSKSPDRALDEIEHLVRTHGIRAIGAVDNILDMRYFDRFLPELARRGLDLDLLYEVKANLTKSQVEALRKAGARVLQPGIESLSTGVLRRMDKGVRALQNVQLLKWCKEFGIVAAWNILWGFPGERPSDYEAMADLLPALAHLTPPVSCDAIRLDRFSPNFERASELGFANVAPNASYRHVYGLDDGALRRLAYFFDYEYADARDASAYTAAVRDAVERWRAVHAQSELVSIDQGEFVLVLDTRPAFGGSQVLAGVDRALYLACDGIAPVARLLGVAAAAGLGLDPDGLHRRLAPLVERALVLREGNAYLALAVPLGRYVPGGPLRERLAAVAALEVGSSKEK